MTEAEIDREAEECANALWYDGSHEKFIRNKEIVRTSLRKCVRQAVEDERQMGGSLATNIASLEDWRHEVANGGTFHSYEEWSRLKKEAHE